MAPFFVPAHVKNSKVNLTTNIYRTHKNQYSVWQNKNAWEMHLLIVYLLSGIKKMWVIESTTAILLLVLFPAIMVSRKVFGNKTDHFHKNKNPAQLVSLFVLLNSKANRF